MKKENKNKKIKNELCPTEFEDWNEKKSKTGLIAKISLIIIFLIVGFYFGYFYFYRNTTHYLNETSKVINNTLDNLLDKIKVLELNNDKKDVDIKGNVESDKKDYNFAFEYKYSYDKLLTSLELDINHQDNQLFKGLIHFQDDKIFVNSKNIYDKTMYTTLNIDELISSDILEENNLEKNDITYINNIDDLKYYIKKIVEYNLEAIKESKLRTKIAGINKKEYLITMGAKEKTAASKKLKQLIENDDKLYKIIKQYNITDNEIFLFTGEISITVNTLNDQIISFSASTLEGDYTGYIDKEKYVIDDEKSHNLFWFNEEGIKYERYENDILTQSGEIKITDKLSSFIYTDKEVTLKIELNNINDKNKNIILDIHNLKENADIALNINSTIKSNNEINYEGVIKTNMYDMELNFNVKYNITYDENLINRMDEKDAVNLELLSEDEKFNIYLNVLKIVNTFLPLDDPNNEVANN